MMKKRYVAAMLLVGTLSMGMMAYAAEGNAETQENVETQESAEIQEGAEIQEASAYTAGDAVDIGQDELMSKVEEEMENVGSVKAAMYLDMELNMNVGGADSDTGMQMDMAMSVGMEDEQIVEPFTSHQTVTTSVSIMGQNMVDVTEIYVREEDGETVSYTGTVTDGTVSEWARDSVGNDGISFSQAREAFGEMKNMALLGQKAVDADGREYYVLEGQIDLANEGGEESIVAEVQEVLDSLTASLGGGSIALPDSVSLNAYIGVDDFLPAKFMVDMSGIKGENIDSGTEGTVVNMEFSVLTVRLECSDYNNITEIAFPDNLPTGEEDTAIDETDGISE